MNAALELFLPRTHSTLRGNILKHSPIGQRADCESKHVLELLLPQTLLVIRGSIPQHITIWEIPIENAALELLSPQTHFVAIGSILKRNPTGTLASHPQFAQDSPHFRMHVVIRNGLLKRTFTWQRQGNYPQSCCDGRSDFAMSQNRHPFVDVQTSRGD